MEKQTSPKQRPPTQGKRRYKKHWTRRVKEACAALSAMLALIMTSLIAVRELLKPIHPTQVIEEKKEPTIPPPPTQGKVDNANTNTAGTTRQASGRKKRKPKRPASADTLPPR